MLFYILPFASYALFVRTGKRLNAHVLIQTKPFYIQILWKDFGRWKKRSLCVCALQREFIETSSLAVLAFNTFWSEFMLCMYHLFILKRVKQYLARNSNGDTIYYTKHRVHCLLLWLFACVLSMLFARCTFLSCLLPKCADNTFKTQIFFLAGRLLFFHSSTIFFFVVCIWCEYRLGVCAWLLRANVIDTRNVWYEKLYNTVFEQAKICKNHTLRMYVCVSMEERRKSRVRARQIVWLVPCHWYTRKHWLMWVVVRMFKYFSLSLFILMIFILFLSFVMDKRIMSVTHWLYRPRSIQLSLFFVQASAREKKYIFSKLYVCVEHRKWTRKSNWIEWIMVYSSRRTHTLKRRVAATFLSFLIFYTVLLCKQCSKIYSW